MEKQPTDPLPLLRTARLNDLPIKLTSDSVTIGLVNGGSATYRSDAPVGYKPFKGKDVYTVAAVAYFLDNLRPGEPYAKYMSKCRKDGVPHIALLDRQDLYRHLNEIDFVSLKLQEPTTVETIVPSIPSVVSEEVVAVPAEKDSAESAEIDESFAGSTYEKTFRDRSTITRATGNGLDFGFALELLKETKKRKVREDRDVLKRENARRKIERQLKEKEEEEKERLSKRTLTMDAIRRATPIIIVPHESSQTSVINLFNAKEFLASGRFVSSLEMSRRLREEGNSQSTRIALKRFKRENAKSSIGAPAEYRICDDSSTLTKEDWKRVIAVFCTGKESQFKGWPWHGIPEILSNVLGFYAQYDDMPVDKSLKQWNLQVVLISRSKRYLDEIAMRDFWASVDRFVPSRSPHLRLK